MVKTVLLTGANGMVGKNILEHPDASLYTFLTPSSSELNLLDRYQVDQYFEQNKVDFVIHAAGRVGGIQANIAQPVRFLTENAYMALNLICSAYQNGVMSLMNMSSSCMYPRNAQNPLSENLILQGGLEPTNEGYALAKIMATRLCEYIQKEQCDFLYKTVIPCNLYGRYDKFDLNTSHMIPAVIKKIIDAKENNQKVVSIWGDGEARREFMYASDLADFVFYAVKNFEVMPVNINVGLGKDYSINEYYRMIADVVGFKGIFEHDLSKPVGMKQKLIDDGNLEKFGWHHNISLRDGLERTVRFYKELYNE